MGPKPILLRDRFWTKVNKSGLVNPILGTSCWEWLGYKNPKGYGKVNLSRVECKDSKKRLKLAHRIAYAFTVGLIPDDMTIDHLCKNRSCVNPSHMEVVTRGENVLRGDTVSARNKNKTHCPKGHEYLHSNIYWHGRSNGNVGRECKICVDARQAVYNAWARKGIVINA
jgi:hypothetical protein